MDVVDQDAHPSSKRLRLDSGLQTYPGGHPHPSISSVSSATTTPNSSSRRPSQQLSSVHDPSPTTRHLPPHSLPPPPPHQGYAAPPGQGHTTAFALSDPSSSLPPSHLRNFADPRAIPSPVHRSHGPQDAPLTFPPATAGTSSHGNILTAAPSSIPDGHASRSSSVAIDAKPPVGHQGMEPGGGGPPAPWQVVQDPRHGSISNGYPPSISPTHPAEAPYHTPSLSHSQHYGSAPATGSFSPSSYLPQYSQGPGQIRRKQVRATQACNHCRARKQKCDEARPCQFCHENGFDCQYKDVPVPKQDRSMMQLQDSVNSIAETLKLFMDSTLSWQRNVEPRLPSLKDEQRFQIPEHPSPLAERRSSGVATPGATRAHLTRINSVKGESPGAPRSQPSPMTSSMAPLIKAESVKQPQPPATPAESMLGEPHHDSEVPDDRRGLESDHTTPAHLLLTQWKWMSSFCEGIPELRRLQEAGKEIHDYPLIFERDRGLLRIWGVGEGHEPEDGILAPATPESASDLEASSPDSAAVRPFVWGFSPSTTVGSSPIEGDHQSRGWSHPGGLNADGKPDFRRDTLRTLLGAYRENIHVLHPFLDAKNLARLVKNFGDVYSPEARAANARSPTTLPGRVPHGVKRKRPGAFVDGFNVVDEILHGNVEKSLKNAIILLVLALGKVTLHAEPLPAPQPDKASFSNGSWSQSTYAAGGSFGSEDHDNRPRNIDLLPGMAYFALATEILGNQQGGNTIIHAQANLLAGLYFSQFARVMESWSWINNACRICLVLIRDNYDKISRDAFPFVVQNISTRESARLNLIKYAYWTCLQLETDILAEMSSLSPTDISKYQTRIQYPIDVKDKFPESSTDNAKPEDDESMLWMYSSLIHLRVFLNAAHNHLYRATNATSKGRTTSDTTSAAKMYHAARCQAEILVRWRAVLPEHLAWHDDDPPSTNINVARVRAKYYGAMYMTQRKLLEIALNGVDTLPSASQDSSPAAMSEAASTPSLANIQQRESQNPFDRSKLVEAANDCIVSAIRSTIAFDRVGADPHSPYVDYRPTRKKRLTLTNIVGTLHAQFGNMLVLAAVYKSDTLRMYLPIDSHLAKSKLAALFTRTIDILQELAPNSPILHMDMQILFNVKRELGLAPSY